MRGEDRVQRRCVFWRGRRREQGLQLGADGGAEQGVGGRGVGAEGGEGEGVEGGGGFEEAVEDLGEGLGGEGGEGGYWREGWGC